MKESLRETRYYTNDEVIRAIGQSIRNNNKDGRADGVRRLPNISQKVTNKGVTILIIILIILLANHRYDRYTIDQSQLDYSDSFPLSKLH